MTDLTVSLSELSVSDSITVKTASDEDVTGSVSSVRLRGGIEFEVVVETESGAWEVNGMRGGDKRDIFPVDERNNRSDVTDIRRE